ncbi:AAEL006997-PA [Aedes aegypti]|uniref:AAEL006997-PA n=1 Tax=Aedes aegypti TaxID=7159 RepID=Q173U2_AEDAE|nr:AAEL006997-PA [Aedes aegypti]
MVTATHSSNFFFTLERILIVLLSIHTQIVPPCPLPRPFLHPPHHHLVPPSVHAVDWSLPNYEPFFCGQLAPSSDRIVHLRTYRTQRDAHRYGYDECEPAVSYCADKSYRNSCICMDGFPREPAGGTCAPSMFRRLCHTCYICMASLWYEPYRGALSELST